MRIHQWLKVLAERQGSDLYLTTGAPPCAKFEGELKTISSDVLSPGEVAEIASELMDDTQREEFARDLEMNLAVSLPGIGRFRPDLRTSLRSPRKACRANGAERGRPG